ncbi:MAG: nitrite reductase, copper-containing [Sandaracinaceae bacterium]|nr:nitrite reductase, copper-containing [Sandaracinaceae bacterium]
MRRIATRASVLAALAALPLALFACGETQTATPTPTSEPETTPTSSRLPPPQPVVERVDPATLPVVQAELGVPPMAAPPTGRTSAAKVVVDIEVREVEREIADGATYTFWTFGGTVPGPMIRVRRGDYVELHLQNHPENTMPHNIDLHAVTGPGGGATSTFTAPGHQTQFSFQALNQGVYIYHCATAPVGMHVANGMYGLIVVEPEEGYPPVDREYYVVQGDFYTTGEYRAAGPQPFDMERAIHEDPSYVVFNGRDGALTGDRALPVQVGETVRLFVGNGGPNLTSSFHVIGEIFDRVWAEGGTQISTDVQTTTVPAGGSAIVDFHMEVPGTYIMVDHALFRAFNHGAIGMLRATGDDAPTIYSGREVDETYLGDLGPAAEAARTAAEGPDDRAARGEATFLGICATCHQREGQGLANVFPPLAGSDFLMADRERSIRIVLTGLSGPVTVNGQSFNGAMPAFANLTDHEVAGALSYVRSHFGNTGDAITDEEVAAVRAAIPRPATGHP